MLLANLTSRAMYCHSVTKIDNTPNDQLLNALLPTGGLAVASARILLFIIGINRILIK